MLALRSTCGLTDRTSAFLCLKGHRGRPQPLDFGHVPWPPNHWALDVGRKRLALPTQSARYGRLVRSPLCGAFRFAPPMWSASFLLMEYNNARAPALLAFFTGARRMYHSSRSYGKESSLFSNLYGNSLRVTLPGSRGATPLFCRSSRSPSFHSSSPLHELVQLMPQR